MPKQKEMLAVAAMVMLALALGLLWRNYRPPTVGANIDAQVHCEACQAVYDATFDKILKGAFPDAVEGGWIVKCEKCGGRAHAYKKGEIPPAPKAMGAGL